MATKTDTLQAALRTGKGRAVAPETALAPVETPPAARPRSSRAPSRADRVNVSAWLDPAYKRSLRMVQAQTDRKLEKLLAEALNDLFAKHNVPQVRED